MSNLDLDKTMGAFLTQYLWIDQEWLEKRGNSASYWQSRLEMKISVEEISEDVLHWNFSIPIVSNISDSALALAVCAELNKFSSSWAFIYLEATNEIVSNFSFTGHHLWDKYLIRAGQVASLMASISNRIADQLATELYGQVMTSFPRAQSGVREIPDATFYGLEARMRRPEWHLDTTRYRFPPIDDIKEFVADRLVGTADEIESNGSGFLITTFTDDRTEVSHQLLARFGSHAIAGEGFESKLIFPRKTDIGNPALICNELNLKMIANKAGSQYGAWTFTESDFIYTQFSTTTELRSYEDSPSFLGHGEELWMLISTSVDALGVYFSSIPFEGKSSESSDEALQIANRVISSLKKGTLNVLYEAIPENTDKADHRFLWLDTTEEVLTTIYFNPMGPTVTTYALVEDEERYTTSLIEISRHPMCPTYRVLKQADTGEDRSQFLFEAISESLGSVPSAIDLLNTPDEILEIIQPLIITQLIQLESNGDSDLLLSASRIETFKNDPWMVISGEGYSPLQESMIEIDPQTRAEAWLKAATDFDYIFATYVELSNAWDGSLNFQMNAGNQMGMFDTGPLLLIYNKSIGRI